MNNLTNLLNELDLNKLSVNINLDFNKPLYKSHIFYIFGNNSYICVKVNSWEELLIEICTFMSINTINYLEIFSEKEKYYIYNIFKNGNNDIISIIKFLINKKLINIIQSLINFSIKDWKYKFITESSITKELFK